MYRKYIKRFLDLFFSLGAFLLLSPIFIFITAGLFIANNGKPFFFQKRPGKYERIFTIIKFKTMNDKKGQNGMLLSDSERLTPLGQFIRKTSLDEIPQLLNVIMGDMSFIGPRPLFVRYLPYYTNREKMRHTVTPGITGLAQTTGRNNLTWDKRLEMDVNYVENISFSLDLKILSNTIIQVISGKDVVVIPGLKFPPLDIERKKDNNEIEGKQIL